MVEDMIDTIGACAIHVPSDTKYVAGYDTGSSDVVWTPAQWARFPHAVKIHINQAAGHANPSIGDVRDIETGAASIGDGVGWARDRIGIGRGSGLYIDAADVGELAAQLTVARIPLPDVGLWVADWALNRQQATAMVGTFVHGYKVVAVQWASPRSNPNTIMPGSSLNLRQANVDLSVVDSGWLAGLQWIPPVGRVIILPYAVGMQNAETISQRFEISVQHVLEANPGKKITAGTVLMIPWKVRNDDTLQTIADRYRISPEHVVASVIVR